MSNRMIIKLHSIALWLTSSIAIVGCTSQQLYSSGQAWQQNECNKINDSIERDKCMASAKISFDKYKKQSDDSKSNKQTQ
jgi:hypothetical protein